MRGVYRIQALLQLVDRFTGPLSRPAQALERFQRAGELARNAAAPFMEMATTFAAAGALFLAPIGLATSQAIGFEAAMADVKKVVDFPTPTAFREMRSDLLDLAGQIGIVPQGISQIAAAAGQFGIPREQIREFTEDTARMSVAFDIVPERAGVAMARLRNIFGGTQDDVRFLADSVNVLSNRMAARAPDILEVLERVGSTGRLVGLTGASIAALGASLLATGTAPEVVGTGLNALIMRLSTASQQSEEFQKALRRIGLSASGLERGIQRDARGAILGFLETVAKAPNRIGILSELFGAEYADDIAKLVGSLGKVHQAFGLLEDPTKVAGSMLREYQARSDTTDVALQRLAAQVQTLGITVGDFFLPVIRSGAELIGRVTGALRGFAEAHPTVAAALAFLITFLGLAAFGMAGLSLAVAGGRFALIQLQPVMNTVGRWSRLLSLNFALLRQAVQQAGGPIPFLRLALQSLIPTFTGAAAAARGFTVALLSNPIVLAVTAIIGAVVGLGAAFVYAWRRSEQFRQNILETLRPLRTAWFEFRAAIAGLMNSFSGLREAFAPIGSGIQAALGRGRTALDALAYAFGFVLGFLLTAAVNIFARIGAVIGQALTGVVNIVRGMVDAVVGLFTGDLDRARQGAGRIFTGIVQILSAPLRLFAPNWEGLRAGLTQALEWVRGLTARMFEAGRDLLAGLGRGIVNGVTGAVQAVENAGTAVIERFKQLLGIRSPSRVFMGLGLMLPLGLAQGIAQGVPDVADAVAQMAQMETLDQSLAVPALSLSSRPEPQAGAVAPSARSQPAPQRSIVIQNLNLPNVHNADEFVRALETLMEEHR